MKAFEVRPLCFSVPIQLLIHSVTLDHVDFSLFFNLYVGLVILASYSSNEA